MILETTGKYGLHVFLFLALTGMSAAAQSQPNAFPLEGMWSDPPSTVEGAFCFFSCTDAGIARLHALVDDPSNDARPFRELQGQARAWERQNLRSLLTPAFQARHPFDPAQDPGFLRCEPWGVARQMFAAHQLEVRRRAPDRIDLRYGEWDALRTIYLDGRSRPEKQPATALGHSLGRWDGKALIVETTGITANLIMLPDLGSMGEHSDRLRIVERYTRSADGATLHLTATLDDPVSFQQPLVLNKIWRWAPDQQITPYDSCERPTELNKKG